MPAPVAGIHALCCSSKGVDGRDKHGHDEFELVPKHKEDFMRFVGAVSIVVLIGTMPALAAELPSRQAGLWEVKMSFEGRNVPGQTIQQCIDAATDQMMQ